MSFTFEYTDTGVSMTVNEDESIIPDIVFSLSIVKGTWFFKKNFGHEMNKIKKITEAAIPRLKAYIEDALQWLIDIGRMTDCEVYVERDLSDKNRLNYRIRAIQSNGQIVTWNSHYKVV